MLLTVAVITLHLTKVADAADSSSESGSVKADGAARQVFDAWSQRFRRFHTGRFKWKETATMMRGRGAVHFTFADVPKDGVYPPEDTKTERICTLICDGTKRHFIRSGMMWTIPRGEFLHRVTHVVFDGDLGKSHFEGEEYENDLSWGFVGPGKQSDEDTTLIPIEWESGEDICVYCRASR